MPHGQAEPAIRRPAASAHPLHVADPAEQQRAAADAASRVDASAEPGACISRLVTSGFNRAAQKRRGTNGEPREGGRTGDIDGDDGVH